MVAGANSVFYGDTLLTTPNADRGKDNELFAAIGRPKRAEVPAPV
jgi:biotin synthase